MNERTYQLAVLLVIIYAARSYHVTVRRTKMLILPRSHCVIALLVVDKPVEIMV